MVHQFDIEVAQEYGVIEAVFISNFQYWIWQNKANNLHEHDGRTWTYNSMKAFGELFPYLSTQTIRTTLKHLTEKDILLTANYNETTYDRTLWYAFKDEGRWLCQNQQMHLLESTNGFVKINKPIPNNKPNNNILLLEEAHAHTHEENGLDLILGWVCDNEEGLQQMLFRNKLITTRVPMLDMIEIIKPYVEEYYTGQLMSGGEDIIRRGRRDIKQHFSQWLPKYIKKVELEEQQKQQDYEQSIDPVSRAMQDLVKGMQYASATKEGW